MGRSARLSVPAGGVVAAFAALVYANVFLNGWTYYDDYAIAALSARMQTWSWSSLVNLWTPRGNYVPLRDTFYLLDNTLFGQRIAGFQATSLLWHAAGVAAFFALVRRQWGNGRVAFLAAVLFAAHPLHVEAVAWVAGSKDVMCFALSAVATLAYLRGMTADERAARWWVMAGVCLVLALASKLAALALPLVFAALEVCDAQPDRTALRRRIRRWLPFAILTGLWFLIAFAPLRQAAASVLGMGGTSVAGGRDALVAAGATQRADLYWPVLRAMVPVTWRYIWLWICPINLSALYEISGEPRWTSPPVLFGLLGLLGLGAATVIAWRRGRRREVFWVAWAAAFYLPVSNILPVAAPMNDRYVHIPSAAGAVLLAGLLHAAAARGRTAGRVALAGALVLALGWSVLTVRRTTAWRSPRALWESAIHVNPASARVQLSLAALPLVEGNPAEAVRLLRQLDPPPPDDYRHRSLLATGYLMTRRPGAAVRTFEDGLARYPDDVVLLAGLAQAFLQQKRYTDALAQARAVLAQSPKAVSARVTAGVALVRLGRTAEGLAEFAVAIRDAPRNVSVYRDAARTLLESEHAAAAAPFAAEWYVRDPGSLSGVTHLRASLAAGQPRAQVEAEFQAMRTRWPDARDWGAFAAELATPVGP